MGLKALSTGLSMLVALSLSVIQGREIVKHDADEDAEWIKYQCDLPVEERKRKTAWYVHPLLFVGN